MTAPTKPAGVTVAMVLDELARGSPSSLDVELLAGSSGIARRVTNPYPQKTGLALSGFDAAVRGGRVLIFASDLNNRWNDFPVQPAFVPFVHETLRYLAATRASRAEYAVGELPGAGGATPGAVLFGTRRVAVNVDPRESDPARITADTFRAGITRLNVAAAQQARAEAREREDSQRLWQYGLLLMIVSLAAEGMIGRRLG